MFVTTKIAEGVSLHVKKTTQFKTVNISLKWRTPLTEEVASERAVLSNVLQHSNAKFQKSAQFRSYLDDLFGTVLYFDVSKRGNEHTVLLNIETVNEQYLTENGVFNDVLNVLHTVIFEPNIKNDEFIPSIVEREKEMVMQRIRSIFDDKTRYAQTRLTQIMRPNHPASISANGTIDAVKNVTPQSLKKAYDSMIQNDRIDIYVIGDIDVESVKEQFIKALPFQSRNPKNAGARQQTVKPENEYTKEQQDMKQGKLHIGFSSPVHFGDEDFPKMQIFNGLFGGYAHSKLFMNVRERESLAYYASSSYAAHHGLIFVVSGIEPANEKKATEVIFEQLKAVQDGDISDLELTQTKAMLTNQLKEALDSARGQIDIYDQYKDIDDEFSVDVWKQRWADVTKEDVQKMASQVELEAIYFLCGKEDDVNAND